jgi:hypothetical protein
VAIASYDPLLPDLGDTVTVRVAVDPSVDVAAAEMHYWLMTEGRVPLHDDGTGGDETPGDHVFTGRIGPFHESGTVFFAAEVTSGEGEGLRDPELSMTWYRFPLSWRPTGSAVINEVFSAAHLCCCGCLAFQSLDGPLEPRNFVEIRNAGQTPIELADLYLTDDPLDLAKISLAPADGEEDAIPPGGLSVAWFYGGDEQRILHPEGGTVFIVGGVEILDAVTYGPAVPGQPYGSPANDAASWELLERPSPGSRNGSSLFLRADVNADLRIDIADPILALQILFAGAPVDCRDAVDVDDDGTLDLADPLYLLTFLFRDGPGPHAPFPALGADATADALDCGRYGRKA